MEILVRLLAVIGIILSLLSLVTAFGMFPDRPVSTLDLLMFGAVCVAGAAILNAAAKDRR